jgi:hypothetical protein
MREAICLNTTQRLSVQLVTGNDSKLAGAKVDDEAFFAH